MNYAENLKRRTTQKFRSTWPNTAKIKTTPQLARIPKFSITYCKLRSNNSWNKIYRLL